MLKNLLLCGILIASISFQYACKPKEKNNEVAPIEADSVYQFSILVKCNSNVENVIGLAAVEVIQYAKNDQLIRSEIKGKIFSIEQNSENQFKSLIQKINEDIKSKASYLKDNSSYISIYEDSFLKSSGYISSYDISEIQINELFNRNTLSFASLSKIDKRNYASIIPLSITSIFSPNAVTFTFSDFMNILGIGGTYAGLLLEYGKNVTALEAFLGTPLTGSGVITTAAGLGELFVLTAGLAGATYAGYQLGQSLVGNWVPALWDYFIKNPNYLFGDFLYELIHDPNTLLSRLFPPSEDNSSEQDPSSRSTGDPHLTTFDKSRYSFMAVGEFISTKSLVDGFEVQVRQEEIKSKNATGSVSFNTGLAINTGNDVICIYPNSTYLNNVIIALSPGFISLKNGWSIGKSSNKILVRSNAGDEIKVLLFSRDLDYYVRPGKHRINKLKGILGNYDSNPSNDIQLADGKILSSSKKDLYPAFANSWRIDNNKSLFVYDTGKSTDSYTNWDFPKGEIVITPEARESAEKICKSKGITDNILLSNCVFDYVATGDIGYVDRAYESQKSTNTSRGFSISDFSRYPIDIILENAILNSNDVLLKYNSVSNYRARVGVISQFNLLNGFESIFKFTTSNGGRISLEISTAVGSKFFSIYQIGNETVGSTHWGANIINKKVGPIIDGKEHQVKVILKKDLTTLSVRAEIYLDDMNNPITVSEGKIWDQDPYYDILSSSWINASTVNYKDGEFKVHSWSFKPL